MIDLDKERKIAAAATGGLREPWAWTQPGRKENGFVIGVAEPLHEGLLKEPEEVFDEGADDWVYPDDHPEIADEVCEQWGATVHYDDAEFITRAKTLVPEALDEIERLRDLLARRDELPTYCDDCMEDGIRLKWDGQTLRCPKCGADGLADDELAHGDED